MQPPHYYTLHLTALKGRHRIDKLFQTARQVTFSGEVAQKNLPKLYLIFHNGEVVYVGCTRQAIGSRLQYGLNPVGAKGYHGYHWKKLERVDIAIWVFPSDMEMAFVEAVEAEVVSLLRQRTGRWPENQTEIHFNNQNRKTVLEAAERVVAGSIHPIVQE